MTMGRGFLYTISIFLLASVFLDLVAFTAEQSGRIRNDVSVAQDYSELAWRMDSASTLFSDSLGVKGSFSRSQSSLNLSIYDGGFPLYGGPDKVNLASLNSSLAKFSTATGTVVWYDQQALNSSGLLLSTENGINYTQDNSNAANDKISLSIPYPVNLTGLYIRVNCNVTPAGSVVYNPTWNFGSGMTFDPLFNATNIGTTNGALSTTATDLNNTFQATYYSGLGGTGSWIGNFTMNWTVLPGTSRTLWFQAAPNTTAYSKNDFNCTLNMTASLNYTSSMPNLTLYMPEAVAMDYGNAHFNGTLAVSEN